MLGNAEFLINEGGENLLDKGKVKIRWRGCGREDYFLAARGGAWTPGTCVAADSGFCAESSGARAGPHSGVPHAAEGFAGGRMNFCARWRPYEPPEKAREYRNIRKAIEDKSFKQDVEKDEALNFLLRDTISLTMMGGSEQTNVIPPEAWANLDVRILPGGNPKALLDQIRLVVDDPNVTVEPLNAEFREANYSPTKTALYEAFVQSRQSIFRALRWCRTLQVGIRRINVIVRLGSTLMVSILTRRLTKKATQSMEMTNGFAWRKCDGGRGFCLMWWRRWRELGEAVAQGDLGTSKDRSMSAVGMLRQLMRR